MIWYYTDPPPMENDELYGINFKFTTESLNITNFAPFHGTTSDSSGKITLLQIIRYMRNYAFTLSVGQ